jgi:hypothetical protein
MKEEVYVEKPLGFEDEECPSHVYKLHKAFYGLKHAPRIWYECLRDFVTQNSFKIGKVNSTFSLERLIKTYSFAKFMLIT